MKAHNSDSLPPRLNPISPRRAMATVVAVVAATAITMLVVRWRIHLTLSTPFFPNMGEFKLWAMVLSLQVGLWVLFASLLLRRLDLVNRALRMRLPDRSDRSRSKWHTAWFTLVVYLAFLVPILASDVLDLGTEPPIWGFDVKVGAVTVFGVIAMAPAVFIISSIREVAFDDRAWPVGQYGRADFALIGFLRSELKIVIGILSVLVTVIVLATGALRNALDSYVQSGGEPPLARELSTVLVLAYGAGFSIVVIGVYAYGRTAINRRASEMLDEWVPVPCMKDSAEAVSLLDRRESLAAYLGLTSSLRESLTTTFVVALPLLSAFLSSLVGAKVSV